MIDWESILGPAFYERIERIEKIRKLIDSQGVSIVATKMDEISTAFLKALLDRISGKIDPATHQKRVSAVIKEFAHQVEKSGDYSWLVSVMQSWYNCGLEISPRELVSEVTLDYLLLYLRLCRKTEILAGVYKGVFWKKIHAPKPNDWPALRVIALEMIPYLALIGREELFLVPENFLPDQLVPISVPLIGRTREELLTEAYFNQHFTLGPEGAEVLLEGLTDIKSIMVKLVKETLIARVTTSRGDSLVALNLYKNEGVSFIDSSFYQGAKDKPMLALLAQIYHDLVTAVDAIVEPRGSIRTQIVNLERPNHPIGARYIPRKIEHSVFPSGGAVRFTLTEHRPPRPHPVGGHGRVDRMSTEHYTELLKWQEETGVQVPWHVLLDNPEWDDQKTPALPMVRAAGHTFVRPHFTGITDERLQKLPEFIRRGLGREIAEKLREELLHARDSR
jgi:hypothetical protein